MASALRVLILEDNEADAELMLRELSQAGYDVDWLRVESEAPYLASLEPELNLILADYSLPQFDALRALRLLQERGLDIPFVVVTGSISEEAAVDCMREGAADYLLKDRLTRLGPAVRYALERKGERLARRQAERALRETMKRLTCLYAINQAMREPLTVEQLCGRVVEHVGRAMQFPESAAPVVEIDHTRVTGETYDDSLSHSLHAQIRAASDVLGRLSVFYTDERPFLIPEEQDLLDTLAADLGMWLERRRAEDRLRTLSSIAEQSSEGIAVADLEGKLVFANKAWAQMHGHETGEELVGRNLSVFHSREQMDRDVIPFNQEVRENGSHTGEVGHLRRDGTPFPTLMSTTLLRNQQGEPYALAGVARDITELKQAEAERDRGLERIRAQARQMQQTVDAVPEGLVLLDAERHVVLANPVAERDLAALAGYRSDGVLTHLGDRPLDGLLASLPGGRWHEVPANGRLFEAVARPVTADPEVEGWVVVMRDVTNEREAQLRAQQQERLAAVGQLAAGIGHDFNNIMATILLYADMTQAEKGLSDKGRERMIAIAGQAEDAARLIRQVLDFSRQSVIERRPLDLVPLLKEQVKLLRRTLPENIDVKLNCRKGAYAVRADPTQIRQMLLNLALNARDAMPGGGKLRIDLERVRLAPGDPVLAPDMQSGEWLRISVSDTGTGIAPDVLPHIFEPFFTTKPPGLGTGLGLPQVHGIVGQHDGHIRVDNRVGKGVTVAAYLPPLPQAELEEHSGGAEGGVRGQGQTIMVVEDSGPVREALVTGLQELGYRTLEATNGQEALVSLQLAAGEVALVLSDMVMPAMGGVALLQAMNKNDLTVPFVLMSGHPLGTELDALREQGVVGWLCKPPSMERLAKTVAEALRR